METVNVAFSCDRNFLIGLYVTTHTMIKNLSADTAVHFHLFLDGISKQQNDRYQRVISKYNPNANAQFTTYDIEPIKSKTASLKGLHGNTSPYYIIFIPQLAKNLSRFIWLDVDTVVNCDLSSVYFEESSHIISAVPHKPMRFSGEKEYYELMGLPLDSYEFNTGFLVVNADEWRSENVTDKLLPLCQVNKHLMKAADQDILNVLFNNNFHEIDRKYNVLFGPADKEHASDDLTYENKVCHFFGSPKPWERVALNSNPHSRYYEKVIKELNISDLRFDHLYSRTGLYRYSRLTIRSLIKSLQYLRKIEKD